MVDNTNHTKRHQLMGYNKNNTEVPVGGDNKSVSRPAKFHITYKVVQLAVG